MPEDIIKSVIGIIVIVVVFIPLMTTLFSVMRSTNCEDYQRQIDSLNNEMNALKSQIVEANSIADYYKDQYENLTNTSITKKDFTEISAKLELLFAQINNTKSEVYNINQQIINIKSIRNTYFVLSFIISLNFALFGLTILDFSLFRFKYSKKLIDKIYSIRNKMEIEIHEHQK